MPFLDSIFSGGIAKATTMREIGFVMWQPVNRDTAVGIFMPLAYVWAILRLPSCSAHRTTFVCDGRPVKHLIFTATVESLWRTDCACFPDMMTRLE